MHAPSALLAGVVLTFGATALANLYLPSATLARTPAAVESVEAESAPEAPLEQFAPLADSDAIASLNEPIEEAPITQEIAAAVEPVVVEPVPAAPAPQEVSEPKRRAVKPAVEKVTPKVAAKPESPRVAVSTAAKQDTSKASAAAQFTPSPSSKVFGKSVPVKPEAPELGVSVSAVSGDRAWVRIGDQRTLTVRVGDSVPSIGRVTSITTEGVILDNGQVLKVAQ